MNWDEIKKKTNLNDIEDTETVNRNLSQLHIEALAIIDDCTNELINLDAEYDKLYTERLDSYIGENEDVDIFNMLKNKQDREIYIVNTNNRLEELSTEIAKKKHEIKMQENIIQYLREISLTCKNINDYQKMRSGL